jgi:hypothetical protein
MKMFKFFKEIVAKENRWGLVIGAIVFVVGIISNSLFPNNQIVSLILQAVTVVIIPQMLSNSINRSRNNTIDSFTEKALLKIENKYKGIFGNSNSFFEIFHLNDGKNFYNTAHNIFYNNLIESYHNNGKNKIYHIPTDTYYKIIQNFLENGYKMKTINGMLLPFFYVPKEKDEALKQYTLFYANKPNLNDSVERITYYQNYKDDSWKNNTVKMIYLDFLSSEKSDDVAVRWLLTLIASTEDILNKFGKIIVDILNIKNFVLLSNGNYFKYDTIEFTTAIKENIDKVNLFLDEQYENKNNKIITNSEKMTEIIEIRFIKDMKKNKFVKKSDIDAIFRNIDYFEDVTEVGYYFKENDHFVMLLNGSNTGQCVEIEIITDENKITEINNKITKLLQDAT